MRFPATPSRRSLRCMSRNRSGYRSKSSAGILTGEVGPENVELEAHRLGIALLDHEVEECAVVERCELVPVVVVAEPQLVLT